MQDTITIRPTIPKAELQKVSGGNLNKWINGLIERAVGERSAGWSEFMDQPRRRFESQADQVRKASLKTAIGWPQKSAKAEKRRRSGVP